MMKDRSLASEEVTGYVSDHDEGIQLADEDVYEEQSISEHAEDVQREVDDIQHPRNEHCEIIESEEEIGYTRHAENADKETAKRQPKSKKPRRSRRAGVDDAETKNDARQPKSKKLRRLRRIENEDEEKEVRPSKSKNSRTSQRGEDTQTAEIKQKAESLKLQETDEIDWPHPDARIVVHFHNKHPLSTLLDGVAPILTDCTFNIVDNGDFKQTKISDSRLKDDTKREKFTGIYLECLDRTHVCIIIGKIKAQVFVNPKIKPVADDMSFCVSVQTFLAHVKSIDPMYSLQLYRLGESSDLHIKIFSPSNGRKTRLMTLGTLNKDAATFGVNNINFPHTVEFELSELRNIVKMAKGINCENIRFRIMETKQNITNRQLKRDRSFFIVHIYGENSYDEHCFCSTTSISSDDDKASTIVIKNSELIEEEDTPSKICIDDLDEKFNNIFAVDYLNSFLKALDRPTVTIRLSQSSPMTMTSCLGDEESFITYMLSSKEDDSTLPNLIQSFAPSRQTKKVLSD